MIRMSETTYIVQAFPLSQLLPQNDNDEDETDEDEDEDKAEPDDGDHDDGEDDGSGHDINFWKALGMLPPTNSPLIKMSSLLH